MVEKFIDKIANTDLSLKNLPIPDAMEKIEESLIQLANKKEREQIISDITLMNLPSFHERLGKIEQQMEKVNLQEKDIYAIRKTLKQMKDELTTITEVCTNLWQILKYLKKK